MAIEDNMRMQCDYCKREINKVCEHSGQPVEHIHIQCTDSVYTDFHFHIDCARLLRDNLIGAL